MSEQRLKITLVRSVTAIHNASAVVCLGAWPAQQQRGAAGLPESGRCAAAWPISRRWRIGAAEWAQRPPGPRWKEPRMSDYLARLRPAEGGVAQARRPRHR